MTDSNEGKDLEQIYRAILLDEDELFEMPAASSTKQNLEFEMSTLLKAASLDILRYVS